MFLNKFCYLLSLILIILFYYLFGTKLNIQSSNYHIFLNMGFKANIDIAISFSQLKVSSIRQQGRIKFRVCLFYFTRSQFTSSRPTYCHPYSIQRANLRTPPFPRELKNHRSQTLPVENDQNQESEVDLNSQYYVSRGFKIQCQRECHDVMQTCCFRTYVDVEQYEGLNLKCIVEMLFCADSASDSTYKVIGRCECKVRKLFDVSTFLPIVFDEFEGVVLEGVYQASLIDFHFEKAQEQQEFSRSGRHQNFSDYLKEVTNDLNRIQTRKFYHYYRQLLERELFVIQERHYDLIRVLRLNKNAEQDFRILKVNPNPNIEAMIDRLEGYNSQNQDLLKMMTPNSFSPTKPQQLRSLKLVNMESHKNLIAEEIMFDFVAIKAHIFKKWQIYLQFSSELLLPLTLKYKKDYDALVKERLSSNVFSHQVSSKDWKKSVYEDSGRQHLKQAELQRKKVMKDEQLWKESFVIENENFFNKESQNTKIFEEIYEIDRISTNSSSPNILTDFHKGYHHQPRNQHNMHGERKYSMEANLSERTKSSTTADKEDKDDHFIILVHGFQASRQDFLLLKNCLEIRFKVKVFISTINEGRTEEQIQVLGKRLALQLQRFLNDSTPSLNYRLSFIGHSMGGVIVRTALCYLENVSKHLHSFISFSSPHLGYLYEPSTHIQAGLWIMKNWQKADSIQQICMRDREDMRSCFLYKLSRSKTLNKFKHIALVGSSQDKYVPYQSARIESNQTLIWDKLNTTTGQIISEMIDGLIGQLERCSQFSRMNVIFNIEQKQVSDYGRNLDSFIGRTAHVKYLSDRQFIKLFCIVFDRFFK